MAVRADAEGQRKGGNGREGRSPREEPEGVADSQDALEECFEQPDAARVSIDRAQTQSQITEHHGLLWQLVVAPRR